MQCKTVQRYYYSVVGEGRAPGTLEMASASARNMSLSRDKFQK